MLRWLYHIPAVFAQPRMFLLVCVSLVGVLLFPADGRSASPHLEAELLFVRGSEAYARQSYDEARDYFSQAVRLSPDRADLFVALGQTQLALRQYREAEASFRRAHTLAPQRRDIYLLLGLAADRAGDYRQAQNYFRQAGRVVGVDLAPLGVSTEEVRLTPEDVRPKKFRQEFALGFHYDSNVELHTRPYYLSPGRKAPKYTDWAGILGDRTEYFPIIRENLNAGLRLQVYNNKHLYLESWDYLNLQGEALLNWRLGPITVHPSFRYDRTWYSSIPYATFYSYGLAVGWPETDYLTGEISYQASERHFWYPRGEEYEDSGWLHRLAVAQGIRLPGRGLMRLGLFYERDLAKGTFWSSQAVGTTLQGVFYLPWNITGWLEAEYKYTRFNQVDGWWGKRQRYNGIFLQLLCKKPLSDRFALWFGYGYANNRANIPEWQFQRSVFQVQLTANLF